MPHNFPVSGHIYWYRPATQDGAAERIAHPHVVVSTDGNRVTLCALTTNLSRIAQPGNVLLDSGEATLPKQSVVEVSKSATVGADQLGAYIGTLDERRVRQIMAGIHFIQTAFLSRE